MTALSAMQSAAVRLIARKPQSFFGSQQTFEMEMCDLLNDVARDIAESHDWQALQSSHTLTGDGVTADFSLPDDYQRMMIDGELFDPNNWAWGYRENTSYPEFLRAKASGFFGAPGAWCISGNLFRFAPAPSGETQFPYISRNIVRKDDDAPQEAFEKDSDKFALDERLLTLALIWRWRAQKNLGYQEDMRNYEIALSTAQAKDKGARIIRMGRSRAALNVSTAYPYELG